MKHLTLVQHLTKHGKHYEEQKVSLYLCNRQTASSHNGGEGNFRWVRYGPNVWRALGYSHVCRPGLACNDLPREEGEDGLKRMVIVLKQGQREVKPPQLKDMLLKLLWSR